MLPRQTIEICDNLVQGFDSEHSQPIEFQKAAQRAAEEVYQTGMKDAITFRISTKLAEYLERRANHVWESLKRAVIATGVEPHPNLADDLKGEIDKHVNPLRQAAKNYLNERAYGLASFHGTPSFNSLIPKLHAEVDLFSAAYALQKKNSTAKQLVNIGTVHGLVGNFVNSQVTVRDYSSINQLLVDHQIPKLDRRELEDIMDELKDAPPEKKKSLLARAEAWIVKHSPLLGAAADAVGGAIGAATKP